MFKPLAEFQHQMKSYTDRKLIKNWFRKNKICGCDIFAYLPGSLSPPQPSTKTRKLIHVNYQIVFETDNQSRQIRSERRDGVLRQRYQTTQKKITHLELPDIFNRLDKDDFFVYIGTIERGGELIPVVSYIDILNPSKYTIAERKNKLLKLNG